MSLDLSTSTQDLVAPRPHGSEPRCDCRSDGRSLVLLAADLAGAYPELLSFGPAAGWQHSPGLGALRIELGGGQRFSGVAELLNFLRGVLSPDRLGALRGAWIDRGPPLEGQLARLLHAGPVAALAPADSSPLLGILQGGRLETWYQPVVRAAGGALWGYECLMRGRTPEGELVYPDALIAWGKQEKLTFMLDRVSRETHLRNAAAHLAGGDAQILLNFMPTAIYDPVFCLATTVAAARAGGIAPGRIIFEVVETEEVGDAAHLRSILDYYRSKGFRVALDDLGSGFSGLAMLGELEPDLIKIDRGLISRALASPIHRSICASLAQLGRDHGKLVLAEGIETPGERDLLASMGVDLLQGYLFGRPSPVPAVPARGDARSTVS